MKALTANVIAIALLAASPAFAAPADQPPTFDIAPTCRDSVQLGGEAGSGSSCLADEAAARQQVQQQWSQFSKKNREECATLVNIGGPPSYVELITCLEDAREAENPSQLATPSPANGNSMQRR